MEPPVAALLKVAKASDAPTSAAAAAPASAPGADSTQSGWSPRRAVRPVAGASGDLSFSSCVRLAPDPPDGDDHEERRRHKNGQQPEPRTAQPDDQPAELRHDGPNLPGGRAVEPRRPGSRALFASPFVRMTGVLAPRRTCTTRCVCASVVADWDVEADHLADTNISTRAPASRSPGRPGRSRGFMLPERTDLRTVEPGVRNQGQQREDSQSRAEDEPQRKVGYEPHAPHDYLSVAARCVPVNVYWIVDDLFWNELPAPLRERERHAQVVGVARRERAEVAQRHAGLDHCA